jgi:hypothetical protein
MADPGESYEKILTANLQRAIDFLRFAEAKNAAVLVLASGWAIAGINLEGNGHTMPGHFPFFVPLAVLFSFCTVVLAIWSFLPRLHLPSFLGGKRAGPHLPNLLYFGDISALTVKSLEAEMRSRYFPDETTLRSEYTHDLTVQISVNSTIAMRKMLLFRVGIGFFLLAAASLLIPALETAFRAVKTLW